jgi:putative phosphoserine phosphatase/1-acylglycerol-3-phosphate O-acyltransferase
MDEQVTLVRNMFLQALGQPEQTVAQTLKEQQSLPDDMRPEKAGKAAKKSLKTKAAAKKKPLSKRSKTSGTTRKVASKGRQVAGKATTKPKTKAVTAKASTPAAKPKSAANPKVASKGRQVAGKATTKAKTKAKVAKASTPAAKPKSTAKAKTNAKSRAPAKAVGAKKAMSKSSRSNSKLRGASVKPKLASTR